MAKYFKGWMCMNVLDLKKNLTLPQPPLYIEGQVSQLIVLNIYSEGSLVNQQSCGLLLHSAD